MAANAFEAIEPVRLPQEWPDMDSPRERYAGRGLLAAMGAGFLPDKYVLLDRLVERQLRSRENITIEQAWAAYPQHLETVAKLRKILRELWGFEPLFIPQDPYALIGQLITGDLAEIEAMREIEDAFGLLRDIDLFNKEGLSMLELVEYIDAHAGTREVPPLPWHSRAARYLLGKLLVYGILALLAYVLFSFIHRFFP